MGFLVLTSCLVCRFSCVGCCRVVEYCVVAFVLGVCTCCSVVSGRIWVC